MVEVGYERFGAQSDIEHFQTMMNFENESFEIKGMAERRRLPQGQSDQAVNP